MKHAERLELKIWLSRADREWCMDTARRNGITLRTLIEIGLWSLRQKTDKHIQEWVDERDHRINEAIKRRIEQRAFDLPPDYYQGVKRDRCSSRMEKRTCGTHQKVRPKVR